MVVFPNFEDRRIALVKEEKKKRRKRKRQIVFREEKNSSKYVYFTINYGGSKYRHFGVRKAPLLKLSR